MLWPDVVARIRTIYINTPREVILHHATTIVLPALVFLSVSVICRSIQEVNTVGLVLFCFFTQKSSISVGVQCISNVPDGMSGGKTNSPDGFESCLEF